MRRFFTGGLYLLGTVLVLAAVLVAINYSYLHRALTYFQGERVRQVDWFEPVLEIKGSQSEPRLPRATPQGNPEERFAEAIAYSDSIQTSALLVYHQGSIVLERYADGYSAESYTQTNSVHKSVVALLIGIAIDEGAIDSVRDPVSRYLPNWIDQSLGEITIEHLLTMASGLGQAKGAIALLDQPFQLLHAQDIAAVARSLPQEAAPGAYFDYDNTNAQLLVEVLENATGQSYEAYLTEKIWSRIARQPGRLWMDREGGTPHGFCCLIAQPRDLVRLGMLVMQQGAWRGQQVVSADWVSRALKPSANNPNYGYLMWLGNPFTAVRKYSAGSDFGAAHSEPFLANDVAFFDGFGGQRVYIVPSRQLVIVRVGETRFDYDDAALPNRVMEALASGGADSVAVEDVLLQAPHAPQLKVRVSYPQGSVGKHRLIVFSHGNGLSNDAYHALTDSWVAQGFVVAAPQHLDSGSRTYLAELNQSVGSDWVTAARVLDMTAVIDQMATIVPDLKEFSGTVQTDRVIAAGHSAGALTAQLMAGAQQQTLGNSKYPIPDQMVDPRVVAVVAVSPPGLIPGYLSAKTWESLATPQLVITGTRDTFDALWPEHSDHFVSYETAQAGQNHLLVLDGMDHYMGNLIGRLERDAAPQSEALQAVAELTDAFMRVYLDPAKASEALDLMQSYVAAIDTVNIERFDQR